MCIRDRSGATADLEGFTNYSIPADLKGVAFLMYKFTIDKSGSAWTIEDVTDLRGETPSTAGGGGTGGAGVTEFDQLTDVPASKITFGSDFVRVAPAENVLEYVSASAIDVGDFNDDGTYTVPSDLTNFFDKTVDDSDDIIEGSTNLFNQTHTGEVTGAVGLTVADNIIDEPNLKATNSPIDNYVLSYDLATAGFTWIIDDAGITDHSLLSNLDFASAGHTGFEESLTFSTGLTRTVNTITTNDSEINHNNLLNTHNLTTDIDHDQLTNYLTTEHFIQSAISIPASQISDFDTEVSNNSSVVANTAKETNVTTDLSYTASTGTVNSSDGTNTTIGLFGTANTDYGFVQGSNGVGSTYSLRGDGSWVVAGGGTIGGSIAASQIAVGTGVNAIGGSSNLTWNGFVLNVGGSVVGTTIYGTTSLQLQNQVSDISYSGGTGGIYFKGGVPYVRYEGGTIYDLTAGGGGTGTVTRVGATNGTFISSSSSDITTSGDLEYDLSATGTPSSTTTLFGDNTWAAPIILTTSGTSGSATLAGKTLNIPVYSGGGGGDVTKVGTPVDEQIGIWTGDGTIKGSTDLVFDGTTFGVVGGIYADDDIRALDEIQITNTSTYIKRDGSTNMTFTDAVTGTKTLAELAAGEASLWTDYPSSDFVVADNNRAVYSGSSSSAIYIKDIDASETGSGTIGIDYDGGDYEFMKLDALTGEFNALIPIIQPVLNGAKTASFTHNALGASKGAYPLSTTGAVVVSIHHLKSGMTGTIALDVGASNPSSITVSGYSDAGSTAVTKVEMNTIANAANKRTIILYDCVDFGTYTDVTITYTQEQ